MTAEPAAAACDTVAKQRVLFVHARYQQRGGEDVVVDAEMQLLRAHGHAVELYSRSNHDIDEIGPLRAGAQTLWSRRTTDDLGRMIHRFRPDVVHLHNTFPLISPSAYWIAGQAGVPTVQTLHNFRLLCPQATLLRNASVCEDCVGKAPWRGVVRRCYRGSAAQSAVLATMLYTHRLLGTWRHKVDRYVAISEFSRRKHIEGGLPADRVIVVPNFADVPGSEASAERSQDYLFVGRLSVEKGIAVLAEAFRRRPGSRLRVVGDGPAKTLLSGLPNVRLLGRLGQEAVYAEMRAAKALVVPSICHEAFGMVVIEAYGCGLPVIGTSMGGLPELIDEGRTGLLIEAGDPDALLAAIARFDDGDAGLLRAMGRRARLRYESDYSPRAAYLRRAGLYSLRR